MNQINILYTFNLHNVISQIYFNKKIKWKKVFFKKKTNKNVNNLNNKINKFDFINVYRSLCSLIGKYTLFLNIHRTFTKINCMSNFLKISYRTLFFIII